LLDGLYHEEDEEEMALTQQAHVGNLNQGMRV